MQRMANKMLNQPSSLPKINSRRNIKIKKAPQSKLWDTPQVTWGHCFDAGGQSSAVPALGQEAAPAAPGRNDGKGCATFCCGFPPLPLLPETVAALHLTGHRTLQVKRSWRVQSGLLSHLLAPLNSTQVSKISTEGKTLWKDMCGKHLWMRVELELTTSGQSPLSRMQSHGHTFPEGSWKLWSSRVPWGTREWIWWTAWFHRS